MGAGYSIDEALAQPDQITREHCCDLSDVFCHEEGHGCVADGGAQGFADALDSVEGAVFVAGGLGVWVKGCECVKSHNAHTMSRDAHNMSRDSHYKINKEPIDDQRSEQCHHHALMIEVAQAKSQLLPEARPYREVGA